MTVVMVSIAAATAGIKASDRLFTSNDPDAAKPCPVEMAFVESAEGGFCIDKFEASAGDNCPKAYPLNQADTRHNLDSNKCAPVSRKDAMPWVYISQNQAEAACSKAGKRLPTNKEWQAASLGTPDKDAGWGAEDCLVSGNWKSRPGLTGSAPTCKSNSGSYDMIGNVWEWTGETATNGTIGAVVLPAQGHVAETGSDGLPSKTSPTADVNYHNDFLWIKTAGTKGIARGGYWNNAEKAGSYATYIVTEPSSASEGVGFRCVRSARF